jgi:hypothetical protein
VHELSDAYAQAEQTRREAEMQRENDERLSREVPVLAEAAVQNTMRLLDRTIEAALQLKTIAADFASVRQAGDDLRAACRKDSVE